MPLPAHTACSHWACSAVALETINSSKGLIRGRKRRERWKKEVGKEEEMVRGEGRENGLGKKERMTTEKWSMMAFMGSGLLLHVLFKSYLSGRPTQLLCCPRSRWWCNLSPTTSRGHTHLQDAPYNNVTINVLSTASCSCEITSSQLFHILQAEQGYMPTLKDYIPYLSILITVQFSLLLTDASPSKFPPLLTSFSFHMYTALSVKNKKHNSSSQSQTHMRAWEWG